MNGILPVQRIEIVIRYFINHHVLLMLFGFMLSVFMLTVSAGVSYFVFKDTEL